LKAGAICYLTKPFDGDELVAALRDVLKKQVGKAWK
jgi:DNA-binding response OmpR family regulator